MIDPATGSELVTVYRPDGTERHLKKLEPLDWLALGNTLKATRKAQKRAEMDAEFAARQKQAPPEPDAAPAPHPRAPAPGMPPVPGAPTAPRRKTPAERHADDVRAEMEKIDRRPVKYWDIERFVNELAGQYAAILTSLSKEHPPGTSADVLAADFKSLGLHPSEWLGVTARLLNLEEVDVPLAGSPASGATANSPTPPPTGGESQTESAPSSTSQTTPSDTPSTAGTQPSAA